MRYLGIRGFESILRGGIPNRAEVLLLTPEGADRYLLGAHWVVEGLRHGERVLLLLSGEAPDLFLARLGRMGIDVATSLASGSLVVVDWFTCWTQEVEGVAEAHRTFRASRNVDDVLAAVDRALPALLPATERRAFVDFLPVAYKALDEVAAAQALGTLREKLGEAGVTAIYSAGRAMSEARIDTLLQTFHAVLDARSEAAGILGFAVRGVGGVKLTARPRRVRLREDEAALEAEAVVRTFSCLICGARVAFDAAKCPSCGTLRAEMSSRARPQSGLMDYVESLGRTAPPERGRVAARPREGRPGVTNGVRAPGGRVNGTAPGRVNGVAPGRTNGLAPQGRTNGLASAAGRTNGLVNGLRRARGGITNGLTNGSGFTNGLGSPRYRHEARRSRWKLYLVPLMSALLLVSPFLLADTGAPARFSVDGSFAEWSGIPGYAQEPPSDVDAAVALTAYKVAFEERAFHLYATVRGAWFSDPEEVRGLYAFIDRDRTAGTGYLVQGLGADALVVIEGSEGIVTHASLRSFSGTDPYNWSAWRTDSAVSAAVRGGALEASIPWDGDPGEPSILLMADDGRGGRSFSGAAFGLDLGAVRASVRSRASIVSRGTPDVLAIDLEAFGGVVTVNDATIEVNDGVAVVAPPFPVTVRPGPGGNQTVNVKLDTSGATVGTLLVARLTQVSANRPVTIVDDTVRAYVEQPPVGKVVDGWFDDWVPAEFTADADPSRVAADRNITNIGASRPGTDLFLYVDVQGQILAGTPVPERGIKPVAGGEPSAAPEAGVPRRRTGEDILFVYIDTDRDAPGGAPVLGLRGADLLVEVRGTQGRVMQQTVYEWRDGWQVVAVPSLAHDARRLEASVALPVAGAIDVVFAASGWQGPEDSTAASGTRGVRGEGDGFRSEGRFDAAFSPSGRVEVSAEGASLAWTLMAPEDGAWSFAVTPVGVQYVASGVEVHYTLSDALLKEEYVLLEPPKDPTLEFPFELSGDAMVWQEEGAPLAIRTTARQVFELPAPFATDEDGAWTPLSLQVDVPGRVFRIPLPPELLAAATYPLVVDPVVSYTLRNDGPSNDTSENMGWSVAVGDFNGDGYADVLTGAPSNDRPPRESPNGQHGYAYIYYGPFSGDDSTPDVWINATPYTNSTRFGYAVAAGRLNSDSYWDALVARRSFLPGFYVGNVSIYYGASGWSGEESTPDVDFVPPTTPKNFGEIVAVGNLDNANSDDVLIAEPGRDLNADTSADGVVYVYMSPFSAAETSSDFRLVPSSNGNGQLGLSIATGLIDSDAYVDVVVGEPRYLSGANDGRFQFYKGSQFISGSGDRSPDATISAPSGGGAGQFGAAVAVGKLDGDAYADALVGGPFKFSGDGRAYVFLANSGGSGLTTGASPSYTLPSQSSGERFGTAVLIADWSGDGTADAIVGAPQAAAGGTNRGRVYYFDDPLSDQTVDETLSGDQNSEFYGRVVAAGKFTNDALMILAIGGYLWDKNPANPNDNDGRVVVAMVPEPFEVMAVAILVAVPIGASLRRTRRPPAKWRAYEGSTRAPRGSRAHR